MNKHHILIFSPIILALTACHSGKVSEEKVAPLIVTEKTPNDTDNPAIWYNSANPEKSLILGTDKGDSTGGIFVFNLEGKLDTALSITNLERPNNIDVEYGFQFQSKTIDVSVFTAGVKVRALGKFSKKKEIESIVVDDELGFVYYSDENVGVRKYYADADKGNEELALFAQTGITEDHEGLSIYKEKGGKGYIILSDQQANKFHVFAREGTKGNPHNHQLVRIVSAQTDESDGSDILNMPLNATFPKGIFVAMSTDRTFQFYKVDDIVGRKSFWQKITGK